MAHRNTLTGEQKFLAYYSDIYQSRWDSLYTSLLEPSEPVSLSPALLQPYYMDSASIMAASCLPVKEGDFVLDMCAAPGGKTLVLALKLNGRGKLISNDRSASRRNRLISVLDSCLKTEFREIVTVTGHDSTKWSLFEKDTYDAILLDAPCSSERHVLADSKALSIWSSNRPKVLAVQQFAMLAAALDAVKVGGYILYSTCSINPLENQGVIEKLSKKRSGKFIEVPTNTPEAEKLDYGSIILPDSCGGKGPLFFCLIRRLS